MMDTNRLKSLLSRFSQAKVAVLGDFFLDLYIQLDRSLSELSLETRKEAFQAVDLRGQPGTAGVVTTNLTALGAQAAAIGVTGCDGNGFTLRQAMQACGVDLTLFVEAPGRHTITYTKPMMQEVDGRIVELNRMDIINRTPNPPALNRALADNVRQAIESYDGLLVVEQVRQDGFGTLSPLLRATLAEVGAKHPEKPIIVDSRHFAAQYSGVSLKMNLQEAQRAASAIAQTETCTEEPADPLATAQDCANSLWQAQHHPIFITLGEQGVAGMAAGEFFHWPGFKLEGPIDIVGAGDSVLAGIGLALCAGATAQEAAYVGNLVGSITVQQLGTTGVATPDALLQRHYEYKHQFTE